MVSYVRNPLPRRLFERTESLLGRFSKSKEAKKPKTETTPKRGQSPRAKSEAHKRRAKVFSYNEAGGVVQKDAWVGPLDLADGEAKAVQAQGTTKEAETEENLTARDNVETITKHLLIGEKINFN